MKTTTYHKLAVTVCLLLFTGSVALLAQTKEQIERFNKEREAYFKEHLELSDGEARVFWPVYYDYENRKHKIDEEEKNNYSYAQTNSGNLSDQESREILEKITDLKEQKLSLEREYYQGKFLEVLPANKVLMLYKVEWDFRRYLLHKLREQQRKDQSQSGDRGPGGDRRNGLRNDPGYSSREMPAPPPEKTPDPFAHPPGGTL